MNFKVSRKEPDSSHPTWHWHFLPSKLSRIMEKPGSPWPFATAVLSAFGSWLDSEHAATPSPKGKEETTCTFQRRRCFAMKINLLDRNVSVSQNFPNASTGAPAAIAHKNPKQTRKGQDFIYPISISSLRVCTSLFPHASLDQCNSWHVSALQIDYRQCKRKCQIGAPKLPPFRERSVVMVMTPSMYGTFWLHCDASEIWRGFHPFWPWVNMNSGRK